MIFNIHAVLLFNETSERCELGIVGFCLLLLSSRSFCLYTFLFFSLFPISLTGWTHFLFLKQASEEFRATHSKRKWLQLTTTIERMGEKSFICFFLNKKDNGMRCICWPVSVLMREKTHESHNTMSLFSNPFSCNKFVVVIWHAWDYKEGFIVCMYLC